MSQSYCTQCGSPLPESGNFCPACGAAREVAPSGQGVSPQVPLAVSSQPATDMRRSPWLAGGLLALAVVLGIALYFVAFRDDARSAIPEGCVVGQPCESDVATAAGLATAAPSEEGIPFPTVARISVAEAKARADAGGVTFVDVRDGDSYAQAHIPGSLSIPLTEIETGSAQLPRDGDIIFYCT